VGIDAHTAFTIWPWEAKEKVLSLQDDTLIAGWNMPTYLLNADWSTYGQVFTVASILPPTGTPLDNTMLMTMSAARSLARRRAIGQRQHHTAPANPSSPGQEVLQEEESGAGVSAVLVRTADGINLQQMRVQLASLDSDLDVITAPAYVQTLRRLLRQARRIIDVCSVITLLLAGVLGVTAVKAYRQTDQIWVPSAMQAACVARTGANAKPLPRGRNMP
jgi:hypothetical protein